MAEKAEKEKKVKKSVVPKNAVVGTKDHYPGKVRVRCTECNWRSWRTADEFDQKACPDCGKMTVVALTTDFPRKARVKSDKPRKPKAEKKKGAKKAKAKKSKKAAAKSASAEPAGEEQKAA
jgi:predicted RNA-binding Zn-ribbon protein involved in translation (DUF1610 family)